MNIYVNFDCFFFSSRRRHTRFDCDWSSDVCSSDLELTRYGQNRVSRREVRIVELYDGVAVDSLERKLITPLRPSVRTRAEQVSGVILAQHLLRIVLRAPDSVDVLREDFVRLRLWKRRVQQRIGKEI